VDWLFTHLKPKYSPTQPSIQAKKPSVIDEFNLASNDFGDDFNEEATARRVSNVGNQPKVMKKELAPKKIISLDRQAPTEQTLPSIQSRILKRPA